MANKPTLNSFEIFIAEYYLLFGQNYQINYSTTIICYKRRRVINIVYFYCYHLFSGFGLFFIFFVRNILNITIIHKRNFA